MSNEQPAPGDNPPRPSERAVELQELIDVGIRGGLDPDSAKRRAAKMLALSGDRVVVPDQPSWRWFTNLNGEQERFDARALRAPRTLRRTPKPGRLALGNPPGPGDIYGGKYPPHADKTVYAIPWGRWVLGLVEGLEDFEPALGGSLSASDIEVAPEFACKFLSENDHPLPPDLAAVFDCLKSDPFQCPRVQGFYARSCHPEPIPVHPEPTKDIKVRPISPRLSAENRALAVALRLVKEGKPLVIAQIAREAECSTRYLHNCKGLKAFVDANNRGKGDLPRGRRDRDTGSLEAWSDEE